MKFKDEVVISLFFNGTKRAMLKIDAIVKGAYKKNLYCKVNDKLTYLILRADRVTIVDSKWVHELSRVKIVFRGKGKKKGRGDFRCRFICEDGKERYIQLGKIICDLESGIVKNLCAGMRYPYDGKQCHHKGDRLNNQAEYLESLTKEEHKKRHMNAYGNTMKSHNGMTISMPEEELKWLWETNFFKGEGGAVW